MTLKPSSNIATKYTENKLSNVLLPTSRHTPKYTKSNMVAAKMESFVYDVIRQLNINPNDLRPIVLLGSHEKIIKSTRLEAV